MNLGIPVPLPAYTVDVAFMARTAEVLGFESFWCSEHPIMPVHSTSRHPGTSDGSIPESYAHSVDPFVALARASGATTTIKLGTGITLIPERNPLLLAQKKSPRSICSVADGSCSVLGAGWHREETQIMGGDFDHRWTQTREATWVMQALWTQEEAEFHGQYYHFPPGQILPETSSRSPIHRCCWVVGAHKRVLKHMNQAS